MPLLFCMVKGFQPMMSILFVKAPRDANKPKIINWQMSMYCVCMCMYLCVCVCMCMRVCIYVYVYVYVCVCVCARVHACMHACVWYPHVVHVEN